MADMISHLEQIL